MELKDIASSIAQNYENEEILLYENTGVFPNKKVIKEIIYEFRALFFPLHFGDKDLLSLSKEEYAYLLVTRIRTKLVNQVSLALPENRKSEADEITDNLFKRLPDIQEMVLKDMQAIFDGDPAAECKSEVVLSYPGLFAIFVYRIAHELYVQKVPMIPRIMTEFAHSKTGIDINPGAEIGEFFMIDHGTGIVIGETARIGNHVQMYQGATLGAMSPAEGQVLRGKHRHPSVGDNVTIYANATLLGGDTFVGNNTIIGGNTFITHSIIEDSKVSLNAPELRILKSEE